NGRRGIAPPPANAAEICPSGGQIIAHGAGEQLVHVPRASDRGVLLARSCAQAEGRSAVLHQGEPTARIRATRLLPCSNLELRGAWGAGLPRAGAPRAFPCSGCQSNDGARARCVRASTIGLRGGSPRIWLMAASRFSSQCSPKNLVALKPTPAVAVPE